MAPYQQMALSQKSGKNLLRKIFEKRVKFTMFSISFTKYMRWNRKQIITGITVS